LTVLALIIAATPLIWVQAREPAIYVAAFHDDVITFVDRNTLRSMPSGYVRVWSGIVFLPGERSIFRGQIHKNLLEFDCAERRARVLQGTSYTLEGNFSMIYQQEPEPWEFPPPDTALDRAMQLSCDPVEPRNRLGDYQTLDEAIQFVVSARRGTDP
jgi:hypothetical protein